jgi:small-conductance mechanosensitive channel
VSGPGASNLQSATANWRTQADLFVTKMGDAITVGVRQHTQLVTQLPAELHHAAVAALTEKHTSRLVTAWNAITRFVGTLVIGAIVIIGLTAIIPFAAAVAFVAGVALGFGFPSLPT